MEQTSRGDSSQESDEWDEECRELDEAYSSSNDEDYASGAEGSSGLAMDLAFAGDGACNSASSLLSRLEQED